MKNNNMKNERKEINLNPFYVEIDKDLIRTTNFDGLSWEESLEFEELEIDLDLSLEVISLIIRI